MKRPNYSNKVDACCSCGESYATPKDHTKPGDAELSVWQPNDADPPQWICKSCRKSLEEEERKS